MMKESVNFEAKRGSNVKFLGRVTTRIITIKYIFPNLALTASAIIIIRKICTNPALTMRIFTIRDIFSNLALTVRIIRGVLLLRIIRIIRITDIFPNLR